MRVVILSKALVVGAYQRKLEELARLGVELTALVPESWREPRVGVQRLERRYTAGYTLQALPIALNGQHHLHFYPTLGPALRRLRPDVLHIDEESFNLATFQAMRLGVALGARCCFYNYANIDRFYPPPFGLFERYSFRHAAHALACNQEAAAILRRHGYTGPLTIVPQFGVDPELFRPAEEDGRRRTEDGGPNPSTVHRPPSTVHRPPSTVHHPPSTIHRPPSTVHRPPSFTVGYLGRLVPEKGVFDLLEALVGLPPEVRLNLVGDGSQRPAIERRIAQLGLQARVALLPAVGSTAVPDAMRALDALVLPSRTTPSWKEQFGRVLIEAMSCGVPVVGSSSGEIPHVIGDAGLVFPEGDVAALRAQLARLAADPALRTQLALLGRERVLAHYTQAAIARRHVAVYRAMFESGT